MKAKIKAIFDFHEGRYGVRRIFKELLWQGVRVSYKRVWRLFKELGLRCVHPQPRVKTTIPAADRADLPDLLQRRFKADEPDTVWYGDITYIKTWDGFAYCASVIDACTKKVVGWSVADHMRTDLVLNALNKALQKRKPKKGIIFHADRGSQYTSKQFVDHCKKKGVRNSVGRTGICYDNAAAESFWATLKKELIHLRPYDTITRLTMDLFEYIDGYYNKHRRHSTLGYMTPEEYEKQHNKKAA